MVETHVRKESYTLKMLRAKYDLTQAQAGKKVGVSADVWHNWEKAKTFPNIPQLQKIEREFNVTYNDIIFLTNNNG
ncbi:XRE family transcriptional regulator [Staphylococcus schleiferi]|uniref:helix-turn-helix transcriptional regulator n=1 Tax=Staphylococcus TaxID=1279 RepID=UPI0013F41552|nr:MULTISPECIES: helix-turn-helix transcriptional regulator [Staphylococcus]NHA35881.1 XRE family transcriptional regulator [Staphylococcus schleiferi]NHB71209.1 XRE family transcriptional regulator [Staphylococcus sp. 191]UXS57032.1 helix-turn-helix transcriptional regulator [Staphylococcus delphini]